jgi:glycosyltransferase involved in cell wall biosynthesis
MVPSEPLVDVVVPVFNSAETIIKAIESLRSQTLPNIRIIVVDDGSTDGTPHLLAKIAARDVRVQIIHQSHGGIVSAFNKGLAQCGAEFVARQDADDISDPRRLECQIDYLRKYPDVICISGAVKIIDKNGRFLGLVARPPSPDLADANWVPAKEPYLMPFPMAPLSALRAIGGYRSFIISEDSDLYWRLQERGRLHNMDAILGEYREHNASITRCNIWNGRVLAVSSQLAAISAARRRAGRVDLSFSNNTLLRYRKAKSLRELFECGCQDLTHVEIEYLEIATAAKILEQVDFRPYELELADCKFIRIALAKRMCMLNPRNRAELMNMTLQAAARLFRKGLIKEAVTIVPTSLYPKIAVRVSNKAIVWINNDVGL